MDARPMPDHECPSHADLSAFNLGVLPVAVLERVADHLEHCPRCEAAVEALDHASDPVIDSLRSLSGLPIAPGHRGSRDAATDAGRRVRDPRRAGPRRHGRRLQGLPMRGCGGSSP